jgi:hypothetical protein
MKAHTDVDANGNALGVPVPFRGFDEELCIPKSLAAQ